ncbi:hypothetical protein AMTRI_Chr11g98410 [Amborella trichopoda]
MQLTPNLTFSLTFFPKTNFQCKNPQGKTFIFFRRKCPSCKQKSFWTDLTFTFRSQ